VLLEEALAVDAVGMPVERLGTILQVGQNESRDVAIVLDQVALGVAFIGPVKLTEVCQMERVPINLNVLFGTFQAWWSYWAASALSSPARRPRGDQGLIAAGPAGDDLASGPAGWRISLL